MQFVAISSFYVDYWKRTELCLRMPDLTAKMRA